MEFAEVMRQWRRMCTKMHDLQDENKWDMCNYCPLDNCDCNMNFDDSNKDVSYEEIEETVMEWAAANPEPVYPTWGDYLISKGLLMPYWNERETAPYDMYIYAERALANHIPADIAQKLGIEPKEG